MLKSVLSIHFLLILCLAATSGLRAQMVYTAQAIQAGSGLGSTYPYSISGSSTVTMEATTEIILGPDCILYPNCGAGSGTTNNYFATNGYDNASAGNNYFLARLVPPLVYAELKTQLDGNYYVTSLGKFNFRYEEKYNDGLLNCKVYDYQRNSISNFSNLTKQVGSNFYSLNIENGGLFIINNYYTLEVINDKGDKWVLRFKYINEF